MAEKLFLQWNDFKNNTIDALGRLTEDTDFSDVTLACEDGQQGHHQLSVKSDENKPFQPNQSALSIYIKIELCYFLLDQ